MPRGHDVLETFVDDPAGIEPFTLLVTPEHEQQRLVWTFQSAHVEADAIVRPPVLTARFEPELSASGRAPQRFEALLDHPDGAPYVSLRASAQDADGNTVGQTLIRAHAP